jgi:hypothetical protein
METLGDRMFKPLIEEIRLEARSKAQQLAGLRRMHKATGVDNPRWGGPEPAWYRGRETPEARNKTKMRDEIGQNRKPDKLADKAHVKDFEKVAKASFEKLRKSVSGYKAEARTKEQQQRGLEAMYQKKFPIRHAQWRKDLDDIRARGGKPKMDLEKEGLRNVLRGKEKDEPLR